MPQIRNPALVQNLDSDFYGNWGDQHARTVSTAVNYDAGRHPVILATGGALGITITLPDATTNAYKVYWVKKVDAGAGSVTVDAAGADTIDGAANVALANQYDSVGIVSDGAAVWHVIEPAGWGGGVGGKQYATFVIAANDTTADGKAVADYVCDGVADEVEIAAAIAAVTPSTFRRILLLEGTFYINAAIALVDNMALEGQGPATVLHAEAGISGAATAMFTATSKTGIRLARFKCDMRYSTDAIRVGRGILNASQCSNIWVQDIHDYDHYGDSFRFDRCSDLIVEGCLSEECYQSNLVTWRDDYNATCKNILFVNNTTHTTKYTSWMFEITGYNDDPLPDPEDRSPNNVVITGNAFYGTYSPFGGYPGLGSGGLVYMESASNVTISDNVARWVYSGVYLLDCYNVAVSENTISLWYLEAIVTDWGEDWGSGGGCIQIAVTGNALYGGGVGQVGISLVSAEQDSGWPPYPTDWRTNEAYWSWDTCTGNTINDCGIGIQCQQVRDTQITGNAIANCSTAGIEFITGWSVHIAGNTISKCLVGIEVTGQGETSNPHSDGNFIEGNYIVKAGQNAIRLNGVKDCAVLSNFIYEPVTDNVAAADDQSAIVIYGAAASGIPKRNLIQGNVVRDGVGTYFMDYVIYNCGTAGYEPEETIIKDNDLRSCSPLIDLLYDCGSGTYMEGNLTPEGDYGSMPGGEPLTMRFTQLTDTPGSYVGASEYIVRVNEAETGLELVALPQEQQNSFTDWCAPKAQAASVSAYATKGNWLYPARNINLLAVGTYMEVVDGGSYVARVCRVHGGQISQILATSEVLEVGGSAFYSFSVIADTWRTQYFRFSTPVALTNNTRYLITISRSDGADNYALPLQETATEYTDGFGWVAGVGQIGLVQKAQPIVGDAVVWDIGQFNQGYQWYYTDTRIVYELPAPPEPDPPEPDPPPSGGTADYYVSAEHGDDDNPGSEDEPFATISKAATVVAAGETVQVMRGTYIERVRLTTAGTAVNPITWEPYPGDEGLVYLDGSYIYPTGTYAVVAPGTGIGFVYTGLLSVEAVYNIWSGIHITRSRGMGVRIEADNTTIENCTIFSNRNRAVYVYQCDDATIDGVTAYDSGNYQVGSPGPITKWPGSLQCWESDGTTIENCVSHDNYGEGVILAGCDNCIIQDNVFYDNKNTNIWVYSSRTCTVQRNFCFCSDTDKFPPSDGMGTGLDLNAPTDPDNESNEFFNNFIFGCRFGFKATCYAGTGGATHSFWGCKVYNNSIIQPNYHGKLAVSACAGFYIRNLGTIAGSTIYNNLIANNALKAVIAAGDGLGAAGITWDYNQWDYAPPVACQGGNDVNGDPTLVREIGGIPATTRDPGNYKLTAGSPGRDQGNNLAPDVTEDYWGTARPQGAAFDMGAHEYS